MHGCCFFKKGLIRHLIIGETLDFQGLNMVVAFTSQWTSFTQSKVDQRLCVSSEKEKDLSQHFTAWLQKFVCLLLGLGGTGV